MEKKDRIDQLIKELNDLNYHYYTLDQPLVSDGEYDLLYDELVKLEKETGLIRDNSPTQRVGYEILKNFKKHEHLGRLYSLGKAQSYEEVKDWMNRASRLVDEYNSQHDDKLPALEYIVELKFDGLTVNLTYDGGKLINAATRGTGVIGEEILAQVRTIKSIPLEIDYKGLMEVAGEGVMPLSKLKEYNKKADVPLKNARNAAAGALRNLDVRETERRNLDAYFYNIGYMEEDLFKSHLEAFDFLRENRFKLYPFIRKAKTYEELIAIIEEIEVLRKEIDVLTDGVVIKINDIRTRRVLGYTNKFPRWALAYKFEAEEYTTIVRQVEWNVGRTGKVTPIAILDPVDIDGVTVARATLNNYDDIERKKVELGSRVIIRRSNDVIPEILMALDDEDLETEKIDKPSHCPYCGTDLFYDKVHIYCPNSMGCLPQLNARMVHFASREAMDIEGLSEKTAEKLMENLNISHLDQIYDLRAEDLLTIEGFKEKKTNNLLNAIEKSKKVKLSAFIYSLGIPNVGIKTAEDLAHKFESFDGLRRAGFEELIEVDDIGEITAREIIDYFHDQHIVEGIERLLSKGIEFEEMDQLEATNMEGLTIVVTGSIEGYNRKEIESQLKLRGAKTTSAVSKNTDILLAGEKAGSKLQKALDLGVKIYQGEDLFGFLEENLK